MSQAGVIETLTSAMRPHAGVRALFLGGSHGKGAADAYSDLDFILVAEDGPSVALADAWRQAVATTGDIVLWCDRTTVPVLINAITADWTRIDLLMLTPEQAKAHAKDSIKPLFDPGDIYDMLPEHTAKPRPSPARFLYQVQEFIRVLGLLPLAIGRGEYILGVTGVFHLRNLLIELLVADADKGSRSGALHLNGFITDADRALLTALPAAEPNRESVIATHVAYAQAYLPRARKRAERLGADWPDAFEDATRRRLRDTLSVDLDAP